MEDLLGIEEKQSTYSQCPRMGAEGTPMNQVGDALDKWNKRAGENHEHE